MTKMLKPQFTRIVALSALLLGVVFAVGNVYLDAASYRKLANLSFGLAVFCDMIFAIAMILWVYGKTWATEPAPKPKPTPMPAVAPQKNPQPPQP